MSSSREFLQRRKKELQEQIKPLKQLEEELEEVESLLATLDKPKERVRSFEYGGWETPGHPPGCRCYPHCDPSR